MGSSWSFPVLLYQINLSFVRLQVCRVCIFLLVQADSYVCLAGSYVCLAASWVPQWLGDCESPNKLACTHNILSVNFARHYHWQCNWIVLEWGVQHFWNGSICPCLLKGVPNGLNAALYLCGFVISVNWRLFWAIVDLGWNGERRGVLRSNKLCPSFRHNYIIIAEILVSNYKNRKFES